MVTTRAANYTFARNEPSRVLSLYQIQPKLYFAITVKETKIMAARLKAAIVKFCLHSLYMTLTY